MAILVKEEGFGDVLQPFAKAGWSILADTLKSRAEGRLGSKLSSIYQTADFSNQAGQLKFLNDVISSGGKQSDALAAIKQFAPSDVEKVVQKYQPPQQRAQQGTLSSIVGEPVATPVQNVNQIKTQPQEQIISDRQTMPTEDLFSSPQEESQLALASEQKNPQNVFNANYANNFPDPALEGTPMNWIPNEGVAMLAASSDPTAANLGNVLMDYRKNAYDRFDKERDYASKQSKIYMDDIRKQSIALPNKKIALSEIKQGIMNREDAQATIDRWGSYVPIFGESWISPAGTLLTTGVKTFVIGDLGDVSGVKNQYLERIAVGANPSLNKSQNANKVAYFGKKAQLDLEEKRIKLTQEINREYPYVPANIDEITEARIKPYAADLQNKLSYQWRVIQEDDVKFTSMKPKEKKEYMMKKVTPGTVLTNTMKNYMIETEGDNKKAYDLAVKLGYKIPRNEDVQRWRSDW